MLRGGAYGMEPRYRVGSLDSGALFCRAYEAYRELHTPAAVSFEHAWFLLLALARREEIGMTRCPACGGVRLQDLMARQGSACANCGASGMLAVSAAGGLLAGDAPMPTAPS
jgi:hypothetical protein